MAERRSTLTTRLAAWIAVVFMASLVIFGAIVFAVAVYEERNEASTGVPESKEEVTADVEAEVLLALAAAAPIGLLLSVGGAIWIARRTLAPVRDLVRAATDVTADRLDRRLPMPRANDELGELTVALNGLLARLEQGFLEQGRFAADASHELRTPLAVVAGDLEVALRRPRSVDEWTETARGALADVGRLARLVDALLQLRRAQIVKVDHSAAADLGVVLEDVIARASGAARTAGVTLELPADLPERAVAGDPGELAIAIGNVVANALRASPRGGAVRLAVEPTADADATILHVDDDGPGVAPGDEERIFAPFTRGRGAEENDGFGLGLAIARRIIDAVGGSLVCERAPGGGARFTFSLPRVR